MKRSVEKVEYLKRLLVGRPLKSAENDEQKTEPDGGPCVAIF